MEPGIASAYGVIPPIRRHLGDPLLEQVAFSLKAGQFGMTKDCVVQGESLFNAPTANLDLATGPIGTLDDLTIREVIKAVGFVLDSDCEPN